MFTFNQNMSTLRTIYHVFELYKQFVYVFNSYLNVCWVKHHNTNTSKTGCYCGIRYCTSSAASSSIFTNKFLTLKNTISFILHLRNVIKCSRINQSLGRNVNYASRLPARPPPSSDCLFCDITGAYTKQQNSFSLHSSASKAAWRSVRVPACQSSASVAEPRLTPCSSSLQQTACCDLITGLMQSRLLIYHIKNLLLKFKWLDWRLSVANKPFLRFIYRSRNRSTTSGCSNPRNTDVRFLNFTPLFC